MIYKNAQVFCEGVFQRQAIDVEAGKITRMGAIDRIDATDVMDLEGYYVIPGMVDVHTHGCIGYDFSAVTYGAIQEMEAYYRRKGVTSMLATLMTGETQKLLNAVQTLDYYCTNNPNTIIKGIHLEGPFFGENKKGAHASQYLREIDKTWFQTLDEASGNRIKLVSIDPTLEGAMDFITTYKTAKTIALGHTDGTYEVAKRAVESGASQITHLFNGMNGLHHREPGLVGVMNDCDVKAELITDGVHIHPSVVRLCFKLNPEKMLIISDSISAAGLEEGESCVSGGVEVTVQGGKALTKDGTIAGATYTGFETMCQAIAFGVEPHQVIQSATIRPAQAIGLKGVGELKVGYQADMLVVDERYQLKAVIQAGNYQVVEG